MILGALLQVILATKIERKKNSSTKKTNAEAISFNYQRQQLEKTFYFYPLGVMHSFNTRNLSCFIDVYKYYFSLITTKMILGALLQVNLATMIERKNISSTKKTNAAVISFNYQQQQLEKTLYF